MSEAWAARGTRPAAQVPAANFKLLAQHLQRAKSALMQAWQLDPKNPEAPTRMITVMRGLDSERTEMEIWFRRAMHCDPNNYSACRRKLSYLDPRWNGSEKDLLEFGHACVTSTNWGGQVPLILADAHKAIQVVLFNLEPARSGYWLRPGVWTDVKASFERFFQLTELSITASHL